MKYLFILIATTISFTISGQSLIGPWETFDDKTQEKKSTVEIYEMNNSYFAKIVGISFEDKSTTCDKCKGSNKDQPIIGLVIIENMSKDGNKFSGGSILDPESGKTYKCNLELTGDDKLKVRGFLGMPVFGRTQYWLRKA